MWVAMLIVFPGLVWALPGYLLSRAALGPGLGRVGRLASTLVLGPAAVVPVAYLPSFLLRTPLWPWTLLLSSGAVSLSALLWLRRAPNRPPPADRAGAPGEPWVIAAVVVVSLWVTTIMRQWGNAATDWFVPCAHKAALYLLEDGSGPGLEVFGAFWGRFVTHVVGHALEPGYGLADVLIHHRIASAATTAHPMLLLGGATGVVSTAYWSLAVGSAAAWLIGRRVRAVSVVMVLTALFQLGVANIARYMMNENVVVLALSSVALALSLEPGLRLSPGSRGRGAWRGSGLLEGLLLGYCMGIRPEATLLLVPLGLLWWRQWARMGRFAAALLVAYLPWALTNLEVFGNPLANPALDNAMTPVEVLGLHFRFHPLNVPVLSRLVRPAALPFPTLIELPLNQLRAFGGLFWVAVVAGLVAVGRRRALVAMGWWLSISGVLLLVVTLDIPKMSYALIASAPLPWLAGEGAAGLARMAKHHRAVAGLAALGLLVLFPLLAVDLELPVDPRPQYGNPRHLTGSLADERARLTDIGVWPERVEMGALPLAQTLAALRSAGPASRLSGPAAGPVIAWRLADHERLVFSGPLFDQAMLPPFLADPAERPSWTSPFVVVSVALQTDQRVVETRLRWSDQGARIDLSLTERAGAPRRFYWLGLRDRKLDGSVPLSVWVRGLGGAPRQVPLTFYAVERPGQFGPRMRLASNHPWSWRPTSGPGGPHVHLVPARGAPRTCVPPGSSQNLRGISAGPAGFLLTGPDGPWRVLRSADWPPPTPACPALRFGSEPPP